MTIREFDAAVRVYKRANGVKETPGLTRQGADELKTFLSRMPKTLPG